jgi:Zn-dependent peptidase ImmA (M78 family)
MANKQNDDPATRVQGLLTEFNVRAAPVPVDKIAKGLGAQLRFSPLDDELSGMIYVSNGTPIIGINSLHHPNRQRFSIAHEIGHLVLHRPFLSGKVHVDKEFRVPVAVLNRDATSALGTEQIEVQANQFAAELLMPTAWFMDALDSKAVDIDNEGPLEELARKFRVSRQALEYRIRNLAASNFRTQGRSR